MCVAHFNFGRGAQNIARAALLTFVARVVHRRKAGLRESIAAFESIFPYQPLLGQFLKRIAMFLPSRTMKAEHLAGFDQEFPKNDKR
jgi:hypothetical protein